jgi:Flp pilus assembly pilin Flp
VLDGRRAADRSRVVRFAPGKGQHQAFAATEQREAKVKDLINRMRTLMRDDSGQDLLEYALLCALIALVAVGAVTQVGNTINTVFWGAIAAANV